MEQSSIHLRDLLQISEGAVGSMAVSTDTCFLSKSGVSVQPPGHHQNITTGWLTSALQSGDSTIPEVADFRMSYFSETDHDFTVQLDLCYADAVLGANSTPASLLCKISKPVSAPLCGESVADACRRETAAYEELKYHDVCRIPSLLFSAMDTRGYTLLLQASSAALPVGQHAPDLSAQIDAVLRELALLHGSFCRHSPVSAPRWLLRPRDSAESIGERYREGMRCLLANDCCRLLSAEHWQVVAGFADHVVAWHKFDRHVLTITHGDMRAENMLYQGQGVACRATLVGWQLAGLRNPMFDVASLLSTSLTVSARRENEMAWLERYRRQFEQSGASYAGIDARDDYRFHLLAPLIFNICAAAIAGESSQKNISLLDHIARNCQAIIDWKALEFIGMLLSHV